MKRILLMLIIAGAIGAGGYLTWAANSGERPFRSALRVACEDKLVDSLKAPSSYRMVSYRESDFAIKPGEARDLAWSQMRE
ncbi:MAG: hypothetical protein CME90_11215 [Hoeflea sp.]|nr:hypothetical protein [Hoeflea sp.]